MSACRCDVLNVMSGGVAHDYAAAHLTPSGVDGMGRRILRCPDTAVEWIEEREPSGYRQDVVVLRRRA